VSQIEKGTEGVNENIYKKGNTADNIIEIILSLKGAK